MTALVALIVAIIIVSASLVALWKWRWGLAACWLIGLLQDPVRKGMEGQPAWMLLGFIPVAVCAGGLIGAALSYVHLLSSQSAAEIWTPGNALLSFLEPLIAPENGHLMCFMGSIGIAVLGTAAVIAPLFLKVKRRSLDSLHFAASAFVGFALFGFVDGWFQSRPPNEGQPPETLAYFAHRTVLRQFGLGGLGQQPREIFIAEGKFEFHSQPCLFDGSQIEVAADQDPRSQLLNWMKSSDPQPLARHLVNCVWAECFGRGLIEPSTSVSELNPASHPELLGWLTRDFVSPDYSLRHLHKTIVNSRVYQLSSRINDQPELDRHFGRFRQRRLSAEQLVTPSMSSRAQAADLGRLTPRKLPKRIKWLCGIPGARNLVHAPSGYWDMRAGGAQRTWTRLCLV